MSDQIILKGSKTLLRPAITQIMALNQLLKRMEFVADSINENYDPGRRYHPLVRLFFREDSDFRPGTNQPAGRGQNRVKGELRFRLMDETAETIGKGELTALGQRIKQIFGANNGYIWSKGKESYCYADWSRGYQLQILARSEVQAKDLVTKILSLQNHTPIWKYLSKTQNVAEAERYPAVAEKKIILGEEVTLPVRRPNAEARFRFADVRITPSMPRVVLYDRTGKKAGALVR